MSRGSILGIRGVKRLGKLKGGKGKSLTGSNSAGKNLTWVFWGEFTWYLRKRTSEKSKCKFDFALQILQIFSLFKYLWALPQGRDLFWSFWKMSPKMSDFSFFYFPDNYLVFYWFILHIWQRKRIWLIVFLTNLWYCSMA